MRTILMQRKPVAVVCVPSKYRSEIYSKPIYSTTQNSFVDGMSSIVKLQSREGKQGDHYSAGHDLISLIFRHFCKTIALGAVRLISSLISEYSPHYECFKDSILEDTQRNHSTETSITWLIRSL